jgi:hypothetical protein
MKVLFDACVPRPLRKLLTSHEVRTAQEMTWGPLKNGGLLQEAENQFEGFITTDQNLKYQQKVVGRNSGILVLPTNDWPTIRDKAREISNQLDTLKPGDFVEMNWGDL